MSQPLHFTAAAISKSGIQTDWSSQAYENERQNLAGDLKCGIPAAFGGAGTGSSPEDFFILSLLNCYIATLKVIAQNSKLGFESIRGHGELTLDRGDDGAQMMKLAHLKFEVSGAENADRFLRLMERISKQCMIINSVKTDVTFEFKLV